MKNWKPFALGAILTASLVLGTSLILDSLDRKSAIKLAEFKATDENGFDVYVMQFATPAGTDQVNCGSEKELDKIKEYFGIKE